ncbi:MAG: FAD-dependent oxidoreductase [Mariniphaga sp.]
MKKQLLVILFIVSYLNTIAQNSSLFIEAENFSTKGGWVVDQQFMDIMGSPYLMAHGMGIPVADAKTKVEFPETGKFKVFVRTFNWTSPWYKGEGPGKFCLLVNGKPMPVVFGTTGNAWMWQDAGVLTVKNRVVELALNDFTGFNGRCDALLFTKDLSFIPPVSGEELATFRKKSLGITSPKDGGEYDLVVTGGGAAGICAAVSAARLGLKVALINDRPVLGGNNSSEIRVGLSGEIDKNLYPNIGNVLKEFNPKRPPNAGPAEAFLDDKKEQLVRAEKNISLFLNFHVFQTESADNHIKAVIAKHIENGQEIRLTGKLFADCTGDATVGYLAGADYRIGRESAYEAFESLAPKFADLKTLGTSNLWSFETSTAPSAFPMLDWACQFSDKYFIEEDKPDWRWEGGFSKNIFTEAENIRDQNLRAIYGNWAYLKNNRPKYANRKLTWVAFIGGRRESRRLMGDLILNQNEIQNHVKYEDASFTTTWSLDLHFPDPENSKYFPEEEFFSYCIQPEIIPYHVPYRCLYSRNIDNLFMAGRNISVTHVAFGSIRVQRTTAMMGEVVGMAASVCKNHNTLPRDVYLKYLDELKKLMKSGIPKQAIQ